MLTGGFQVHTTHHSHTTNMKTILCICAVVAAAAAFPQAPGANTRSLPVAYKSDVRDENGQISLVYQTVDNQVVEQTGVLKPTNDGKDYFLAQRGKYSFISPEGRQYQTDWVADQQGFRAQGSHIPVQGAPEPAPAPAPSSFAF